MLAYNVPTGVIEDDRAITISLVTPTFNSERYLEQTIKSVVQQCYPKLQYIIIDGGSTDRTLEIIRDYEPYIDFWVSEADDGPQYATAKGLARTTGAIMGWINSDDILFPWTLHTIGHLFMRGPEIEWITGLASTIDQNGIYYQTKTQPAFRKESYISFDSGMIQQESTFWRRTLWEKAGNYHNVSYKYAHDLDLWCRFFFHSKLHTVPMPLGAWRRHASNISHDPGSRMEKKAVRKHYRKLLTFEERSRSLLQHWRDRLINLATPAASIQYDPKNSTY